MLIEPGSQTSSVESPLKAKSLEVAMVAGEASGDLLAGLFGKAGMDEGRLAVRHRISRDHIAIGRRHCQAHFHARSGIKARRPARFPSRLRG